MGRVVESGSGVFEALDAGGRERLGDLLRLLRLLLEMKRKGSWVLRPLGDAREIALDRRERVRRCHIAGQLRWGLRRAMDIEPRVKGLSLIES